MTFFAQCIQITGNETPNEIPIEQRHIPKAESESANELRENKSSSIHYFIHK